GVAVPRAELCFRAG
ncbi:hypothetical protein A2U01_0097953, partial [Trifolium medium]|nr:hypothetical protein [Trifolium medium]